MEISTATPANPEQESIGSAHAAPAEPASVGDVAPESEPEAETRTPEEIRELLRDKVQRLRTARIQAERTAVEADELREAFLLEHVDILKNEKNARETAASIELEVRSLAIAFAGVSKDKKPTPGVEITDGQEFEFDEAAALAWCTEKGLALIPAKVDGKTLKGLAAVVPQELPFARFIETPKVKIAADLSKVLEKAAVRENVEKMIAETSS